VGLETGPPKMRGKMEFEVCALQMKEERMGQIERGARTETLDDDQSWHQFVANYGEPETLQYRELSNYRAEINQLVISDLKWFSECKTHSQIILHHPIH
jgi:hypothetical protein